MELCIAAKNVASLPVFRAFTSSDAETSKETAKSPYGLKVAILLAGLALVSAEPAFALSIVPLEGTDWLEDPVSIGDTGGSPDVEMRGFNIYFTWSGPQGVMFSMSADPGRTFSEPVSLAGWNPDRSVGMNPAVIANRADVYVVYSSSDDIFLVRSQEGGRSFGEPLNVSRTAISSPYVVTDHAISVSGGNVYVAWTVSSGNWSEIYFAQSFDGGRTFAEPKNISDSLDQPSQLPRIASSGNEVYVAWYDIDEFNILNHVSFARSDDGGRTFHTKNNFSGNNGIYNAFEHQVAAAGDGTVYVVWREETMDGPSIVFAKSSDSGRTFDVQESIAQGAWPIMDVSGDNIYLSYGAQENIEGRTVDNVAFSRSKDSGETFSRPVMLSNQTWGLPSPYDSRGIPTMASDGNNVFVAWRYTTNATGTFEVFLATSYDGGDRFTVPVVVSTSEGDVSHEGPVLAADDDTVAVMWLERSPDEVEFMLSTGTIPPTYTGARELDPAFMTPVEPYGPPYFLFGIGGAVAAAILGVAFLLRKRRK